MVKTQLLREDIEYPDGFEADEYEIYQGTPSFTFKDNERFELGERTIEAIHTPGHSPGHVCFYEANKGYLYSGDLIYEGTLDAFYPTTNPIEFMNSIKRIKEMQVNKILPGHHKLDIDTRLIDDIEKEFRVLYNEGKLIQGNGIYQFKNFNIHI